MDRLNMYRYVFRLQSADSEAAQTKDGWADGGSEMFISLKSHKGKA